MIDRDRMNTADPRKVANVAMGVIDAIQDYTPEQMALGQAAAFIAFCNRFNLHPGDAFAAASRIVNGDERGICPEFRAVHTFLRDELH